MPTLVITSCPRCGAHKIGSKSHGELCVNSLRQVAFGLFQCAHCQDGFITEFPLTNEIVAWYEGNPAARPIVIQFVPEAVEIAAPAGVPQSCRSAYEQGQRALDRMDYDAAGMMFRKSLENAVKTLNPNGQGSLKRRIDGLSAESGVTPAMREWAHAIRDDGNDAAHEEEAFTKAQAETLQAFTEMFLTYTFTLPEMVQTRREGQLPPSS